MDITNPIRECLHSLIDQQIWRLSQKTFVYEFHEYRKKINYPVNPHSSQAFNKYMKKINSETILYWFGKYPQLKKLIINTINNICSYMKSICENFINDEPLLLKHHYINKKSCLKSITSLNSDPHNGGKVVLCFEFSSKEKIIYKPKSLYIDTIIEKLFREILQFNSLNGHIPIAETINKTNYGWQKFISKTPLDYHDTNVAYYNLGLCSSIFSTLGANDLHDENIIFDKEYPYFIDLETCLQPYFGQRINSLPMFMEHALLNSIANTSIIPAQLVSFLNEILVGAINSPYPQKTKTKIFTFKNFGTDAMDIAKDLLITNQYSNPLLTKNSEYFNPLPLQKHFIDGFSQGYMKILEKKEEIQRFLDKANCISRVVARPTDQYYLMIDACLFPENLVSEDTMNRVLKYLKPSKLFQNEDLANDVLEEEKKVLKLADIPYFYYEDKTKILQSTNRTFSRTFGLSAIENAKAIIRNTSEKNLLLNKRFIAEGFSYIKVREAKYNNGPTYVGFESPIFQDVIQKTTVDNPFPAIKLLYDLSITFKNETGWIGGVYSDIPIAYNSISFMSLHDTGGLLFLFNHLKDYKRSPKYNTFQNQLINGVKRLQKEYFSPKNTQKESIIFGNASIEFLLNFKENRNLSLERLAYANNYDLEDLFNGASGIGLVLSSFLETPKNIIRQLLRHVKTIEDKKDNGIAHGNLGII